ncbi:hypothetical protein KUF71_017423 [Frankliniella fusca]|uniref:Uncharacterized protein n=1 Tax=Frankliniella fusca TaxID=407009 RepID=A0AAE1I4A3_9NEOP|nr:hypothetical protein KUF71_017423 [Frankliniella fusca]
MALERQRFAIECRAETYGAPSATSSCSRFDSPRTVDSGA